MIYYCYVASVSKTFECRENRHPGEISDCPECINKNLLVSLQLKIYEYVRQSIRIYSRLPLQR